MSRNNNFLVLVVLSAFMLFQYNNCGSSNDGAVMGNFSSDSADVDSCTSSKDMNSEECENKRLNPDMLLLEFTSNSGIIIPAAMTQYDLGGVCEYGYYPTHDIFWKLKAAGTDQATSYGNTKCENGRFIVYLPAPADKTKVYYLEAEIIGYDFSNKMAPRGLNSYKYIQVTVQ